MRSLLLTILFAAAFPAAAQDLTVTPGFDPAVSRSRTQPLTLEVSRPLSRDEGRLAVLLDEIDLSALIVSTGTTLRYEPIAIPLPSGSHTLKVFLVSENGAWREIASIPVSIRTRGGFERASLDPSLTLNNKGQIAERTLPAPELEAEHRIYQDFTGQADLRASLVRRDWNVSATAQLIGVSYQKEALRFGTLAEEAPRVDLAGYGLEVGAGPTRLQVGHVSHGRHRHVISGFASRGVVAGIAAADRFEASVAALSATRMVGWRNPLGLADPNHRLLSGLVAVDALRAPIAQVRLEGSVLAGSVVPTTGFNQGGIPDAATSRGGGLRLIASGINGRLRLEAGYAGSRYDNPLDRTLAQGDALVPVRASTNYAHYVDASVDVLRNVRVTSTLPVALRVGYRRERVDPLYQTVAAYVQSDRLHDAWEVQTSLGAASIQATHVRSRDNLADVPSILTTRTRQSGAGIGLPLQSFVRTTRSALSSLLPTLSYSFSTTIQVAAGLPENGGFSASHLPNQRSTVHSAGAAWYAGRWSAAYRMSAAFQDNRQEGREMADFLNTTHGISLSVAPLTVVNLSVDLDLDRAENREQDRVDHTRRIGFRAVVRPLSAITLTAYFSPTRSRDDARSTLTRRGSTSLEGAYAFSIDRPRLAPVRGQFFVRYARSTSSFRGADPSLDARTEVWSINSGISLSLF